MRRSIGRGFSFKLNRVTAAIAFLIASVDPGTAAPLISETNVAEHVQANLARYMMEQSDWCKLATKEVEENEIVAPYVEALANAGANAEGVRVVECTYEYSPEAGGAKQEGYAILLDVPAAVIARWIYNACKVEAAPEFDKCARKLVSEMRSNSGGQYPISGFVSEGPNYGLCKQHGKPVKKTGLIAFRNGVTIQFSESSGEGQPIYYCTTDPISVDIQKQLVLSEPAASVYFVARLAALHLACWDEDVKNDATGTLQPSDWQKLARTSVLEALESGRDRLFEFKARKFAAGGKTC